MTDEAKPDWLESRAAPGAKARERTSRDRDDWGESGEEDAEGLQNCRTNDPAQGPA